MNSRTKYFIVILSLLLNIFFISWMGSQWLKNRVVYASLLSEVMYTVPVEARPAFRKNLQADKDALLQALKQLREGRSQVSQLLAQPELDRKAVDKALVQVKHNLNIVVALLQNTMVETMQDLPPEVRQEWAKQWKQDDDLLAMGIEKISKELDK